MQVAAPEAELLLGKTATSEGILSTIIIIFLFHHTNLILTLACLTFADAVAINEGEISLNITEMIEELS